MLISYKVKGYKTFNEEVELNFKANKYIKDKDNVFVYENGTELVKSAMLYGPNNTGKSCLIESLSELKKMILDGKVTENLNDSYLYNIFDTKKEMKFTIEFIDEDTKIMIKYEIIVANKKTSKIVSEVLVADDIAIFNRNETNSDLELNSVIDLYKEYPDKLIVSTLPKKYKRYSEIINNFFVNLVILNKNYNALELVPELKKLSASELSKFKKIIKNADISISDISINEELKFKEEPLLITKYMMNNISKEMLSFLSDSVGTKVFMRYIVEIIKLQKNGGVIIVDEIDRSLHTLLTKSILSIFNNEKNKNVQLFATTHDLMLLDCLYLFRKDQIWFSYKDKKQAYLYSLDNFKSNSDTQVRNKTVESYLKGLFGSLPDADIIKYIYND